LLRTTVFELLKAVGGGEGEEEVLGEVRDCGVVTVESRDAASLRRGGAGGTKAERVAMKKHAGEELLHRPT
jgi:hypothetical protein